MTPGKEERYTNIGRLREQELVAKKAAIKIQACKVLIRKETDPHRDIENMDLAMLAGQLEELNQAMRDFSHATKLIEELRASLGYD